MMHYFTGYLELILWGFFHSLWGTEEDDVINIPMFILCEAKYANAECI